MRFFRPSLYAGTLSTRIDALSPSLSVPTEFVPSSQRYASTKLARAAKYRGRKDQQAVRAVRQDELRAERRERDDKLGKRNVFA